MTTIAAKITDGVGSIAADTRETWGYSTVSSTIKLYRFKRGPWRDCIIGWAGASHLSNVIIDCLENTAKPIDIGFGRVPDMVDIEMEGSAVGIILAPDGLWSTNESCRPKKETLSYLAEGSGGHGALALMAKAGFTPEQAVDAMCDLDVYTGRPITVMQLDPDFASKVKQFQRRVRKYYTS
jgi:ATP-dependent protease HslVU (ClpYQ) peptidase subunit